MTTTSLAVTISVLLAALVFQGVRTWLELRGTRLVICPATRTPAAVEVDVRHTVITGAAGLRELRVRDCSQWPERNGCGQICLSEIEEAPCDCLAHEVVRRWFQDKSCALCGRPIGPAYGQGQPPAFNCRPQGRVQA
jgi:hypothetical protein